eukprot:1317301-Amorphochlora_amoeboformis.AAC.1
MEIAHSTFTAEPTAIRDPSENSDIQQRFKNRIPGFDKKRQFELETHASLPAFLSAGWRGLSTLSAFATPRTSLRSP